MMMMYHSDVVVLIGALLCMYLTNSWSLNEAESFCGVGMAPCGNDGQCGTKVD